jgi:VanZ family protein
MIAILKKYWISTLMCAVILVLCLMNTEELPGAPMSNFDKLVHLIMFLTISGVFFFDRTQHLKLKITQQQLLFSALLFPILFGGIIEILQEYCTLTRSGDWMDWVFDSVGAVVGWVICWGLNAKQLR